MTKMPPTDFLEMIDVFSGLTKAARQVLRPHVHDFVLENREGCACDCMQCMEEEEALRDAVERVDKWANKDV
jgi:hypothetical protein